MVDLSTLASKGEKKLKRKLETMKKSYANAKDRAIKHFEDVGFGPTRVSNYRSAWSDMPTDYNANMTEEKITKWRENWIAKMKE